MPSRTRLSVTALGLVAAAIAPASPSVYWTIPPSVIGAMRKGGIMKTTPKGEGKKSTRSAAEIQSDLDALSKANLAKAGQTDAKVPPRKVDPVQTPNPPIPTESQTVAPKAKSSERWLKSMIADRVNMSGNRVFGYHSHTVEGDQAAFDNLNYFGRGSRQFTDNGMMTVSGRQVLGFLDFDLTVSDNRIQDPYSQRTTLAYNKGPLTLGYGDIRADLTNTNQFARFNRTLNGTVFGWKQGRMEFKAVHSVARGSARTISLAGANSAGPYYLQSGQVLADSLEVQLDGQEMRLGDDYILDSDLGAITFVNRMVSPTSTIVATFEAQSFADANGNLRGAGFSYDFGRVGRLGLTMLEQTGIGDAGSRQITQYFFGRQTWYALDTYAREGTLQVFIGKASGSGIISRRLLNPAEYEVDTALPRFRITAAIEILPDDMVEANFRPKIVQSNFGDRRTMGVDWRMPFGKRGRSGYLQLDYADGRSLGSDGTHGIAKGATIGYRHGDLSIRTGVRDIPASYVTVESRGFQRNERAWDVRLDYARGRFNYGFNHTNSAIGALNSSGVQQNSRAISTSGRVSYSDPGGSRWSLSQTRTQSRSLYQSRLDTTTLSGAKALLGGRLSVDMGLDYQTGRGPMAIDDTVRTGDIAIATARTGFDYRLGGGLSANGRMGFSRVSTLRGEGNGRDTQFGLTYQPNDRWNLSAVRIDSDSGQLATLNGFSNGFGLGYGGNGFSGGALGDVLTASASSLQSNQLTADYRASDRFTLSGRAYQSKSSGEFSSNAESTGFGFAMNYDVAPNHNLALSFDRSATQYFGSGDDALSFSGRSEGTSYSLDFMGAPKGGRLNYSIGASNYVSSGNSGFAGQTSLLWDAKLGYRLNRNQRLSFNYVRGLSRGFFGQNESLASAAYEYRLWGNVALRGVYRWRNIANVDGSTLGSYRSRGLDLELVFDFGR